MQSDGLLMPRSLTQAPAGPDEKVDLAWKEGARLGQRPAGPRWSGCLMAKEEARRRVAGSGQGR